MNQRDALAQVINDVDYYGLNTGGKITTRSYETADAIIESGILGNVEYEYAWSGDRHAYYFYETQEEAEEFIGEPKQYRRTKPGKWEEV